MPRFRGFEIQLFLKIDQGLLAHFEQPLHGTIDVRDTLKRLAEKYGARFQPDPGWDSLQ